MRRLLVVGAAMLFSATGAYAQAKEVQTPEPAIVSLSYTSDGAVDPAEVSRLLDLRVGQPLTEKGTGNSIRNLFATGQFADVQIASETVPGGVAVVVHLARSFRVRPLRFVHGTLSRDELLRALSFSEGSVFQPGEIEEGAAAIRRRLEAEGYLHAEVTPEVTFDRERFRARVVFHVESGKAARVAPAFFDGDTKPFSADELRARLHLDPGDRYRESRARADAERVTEFLHKNSRLKGSVELIAAQPTDDGRIMPVYRIVVGPQVVFEAVGIRPKKLQSEIHSLLEGQNFDEDLILQYVENKRGQLQGKGFYRARVEYVLADRPDTYAVRVTVDSGPHEEVEKIVVRGNQAVPTKTLLGLMVTRKKGLPFLQPGHLVEEDLRDDVSAIKGYYQTRGWVGAKVSEPQITEGSKPDRLVVTLAITEGPRAMIRSRTIAGVEHMDGAPLEAKLLVKAGQPYNPNLVRQDVTNLQSEYRDRGWGEAAVHAESTLATDGTAADVVYRVDEGSRSFFGKTILRGNSRTDTDRVRRLVTWEEGKPFSEVELLNTQRNLSRAGVFRRVEMKPEPADPQTSARNVEIALQEGKPLSLLYGVGYQYAPDAPSNQNDPFLVLGASYNNLFGRMLSAGIEGQVSISGRYRAQLSFRNPYFLDRDLTFTSFFFATREPIQNLDIDRLGFANELSHYFGKNLRVALRAEYQRIRPVNPENLSQIEASDFPRFDQPIEETTIGSTAFYDRRDDVIDPHTGYYVSGGVKYAFPFLADARYAKFSTQVAWFRPVRGSVVALSTRLGGIFPYGPSNIQVPIAERFFGGGESTARGFPRDLLGIPGQTVDYDTRASPHTGSGPGSCAGAYPTLAAFDCSSGPHIRGGNGFFALNAEFRFPILGGLGGTIFYDLGQVWENFSQLNLRLEGESGLRQTAGFGLHYMTPIGPLRAEVGLPLRPRTIVFDVKDPSGNSLIPAAGSEREKGRFLLTIGYPF